MKVIEVDVYQMTACDYIYITMTVSMTGANGLVGMLIICSKLDLKNMEIQGSFAYPRAITAGGKN